MGLGGPVWNVAGRGADWPKGGCPIVPTHCIHPPLICRSLGPWDWGGGEGGQAGEDKRASPSYGWEEMAESVDVCSTEDPIQLLLWMQQNKCCPAPAETL